MKRSAYLLMVLSLGLDVAGFGGQQQQVTTPVQAQAPAMAKPQKTTDANVDPNARNDAGHGDASKDVASMVDTATCTHTGRYFYNVDPYGQLTLVQHMNCAVGGAPIGSTSSAFLCQLNANLQCDNRQSQQVMKKVPYGRNVYAATSGGVTVNGTQFPWADATAAQQNLPLIKAKAAQQIAAYQRVFNQH
jgi:hypothetical protein